MKRIFKFIPAFALVLGVLISFATTAKSDAPLAVQLKGLKSNGQWVPVTPGYQCQANPDRICTKQFDTQGNPIEGTETMGNYVP